MESSNEPTALPCFKKTNLSRRPAPTVNRSTGVLTTESGDGNRAVEYQVCKFEYRSVRSTLLLLPCLPYTPHTHSQSLTFVCDRMVCGLHLLRTFFSTSFNKVHQTRVTCFDITTTAIKKCISAAYITYPTAGKNAQRSKQGSRDGRGCA